MQTMIDPATLRAVEKAAKALRLMRDRPHTTWTDEAAAAIATFLDAMGQDIAAARVRRCVDQQTKGDA
jgi:hypothetical protein